MTQGRRIRAGSGKQVLWFIFAYLPLLALPSEGFLPNFWSRVLTLSWDSYTHQYMTEQAILTVTQEVLRDTSDQHRALAEDEVSLCFLWVFTELLLLKTEALDHAGQTRPCLLESRWGGRQLQRRHRLHDFHQVRSSVPLWLRAYQRRHFDATTVMDADRAVSASQRVPERPFQLGSAIPLPPGLHKLRFIVETKIEFAGLSFEQFHLSTAFSNLWVLLIF